MKLGKSFIKTPTKNEGSSASMKLFYSGKISKIRFVLLLNLFWLSGKFRYCSLPGKNCSPSTVSLGYMTSRLY